MRVILIICGLVVLLGGVLFALDRGDDGDRSSLAGLPEEPVRRVVDVTPEPTPGESEPDPERDLETQPEAMSEETTEETTETATEATPDALAEATPPKQEPPAGRARIERLDGRSIRLADRYVLRGNGTERDPYTISWELLGSAAETIDAAKGELEPPAHIALLDGAWVRIDGYYSSPLSTEEVHEVLLTLNQWDGCCIGLPPSPFDCLETNMARPINMRSKHLVRFGTVTGRMSVQPFAIGNWLMGLYRLDEAKLDMGPM